MAARSTERGHPIVYRAWECGSTKDWLVFDSGLNLLGRVPTHQEGLDLLNKAGELMTGYMTRGELHSQGHIVVPTSGRWLYVDTGETTDKKRPCKKCKCFPTPEGYDACLGHIPGARSACCGHGVEPGYVLWNDRFRDELPVR